LSAQADTYGAVLAALEFMLNYSAGSVEIGDVREVADGDCMRTYIVNSHLPLAGAVEAFVVVEELPLFRN